MEPNEQMDAVYLERNRCVLLAARLALANGLAAGMGIDEKEEPGWQHVIYIDLPTGQVSWHIPDSFLAEIGGMLPAYLKPWDGHTTEEKYWRMHEYQPLTPQKRIPRDYLGYQFHGHHVPAVGEAGE